MNLSRNRRTLMGLSFDGLTIHGDLRNAVAYRSTWNNCTFHDMSLAKADFAGATLVNCVFIDCDLDQVSFRSASIKGCGFVGGRCEYASFENATLNNVRFDTQLHGTDLRYASAEAVDYYGSNLWGATINVSCNSFKGMAYDERSVRLFLAILGSAESDLKEKIRELAGEEACAMMDRLFVEEEEAVDAE